MNEIVVVGDVHEGMNFERKIDADTGISARALDIHNAFVESAKFAIGNKSKLFVIAGDLFDRSHVSPGFRELVRKDVIEPLGEAGIEIWLLAGNHDQPHSFRRATSLDDYRGYSHVKVFRKPAKRTVEINGRRLGAVIVPYLHPEQIIGMVEKSAGKEVPMEQWNILAQKMLKELVAKWTAELREEKCDFLMLAGHYYITGAKLSDVGYTQVLPDEFQFTKDMIPEDIDIAVFGHIHIHQQIQKDPPVIYTGAVERIDWGECGEEKGFVSISLGKSLEWKFEKVPVREMAKIAVRLDAGDSNPTAKIISSLPADVAGAMLRVDIQTGEATRKRIDGHQLAEKLAPAFDYELRYSEASGEKASAAAFSSDPFELVRDFIDANYKSDPRHGNLQKRAREIMEEVLK